MVLFILALIINPYPPPILQTTFYSIGQIISHCKLSIHEVGPLIAESWHPLLQIGTTVASPSLSIHQILKLIAQTSMIDQ